MQDTAHHTTLVIIGSKEPTRLEGFLSRHGLKFRERKLRREVMSKDGILHTRKIPDTVVALGKVPDLEKFITEFKNEILQPGVEYDLFDNRTCEIMGG